ncbi:MAG: family 78 glycoside hydrolase catalytic domain [Clostridiales bacterium]|nr:family 78 glycoside hydrolase catalytic domain [Clostridiales bacterium]
MHIYDMKTNHLVNPLGFDYSPLRFSYKISSPTGNKQSKAQITIWTSNHNTPLYDTGLREDIDSLCFSPEIALAPRTCYSWQVTVITDEGKKVISPLAFFETGKLTEPWQGKWITAEQKGKNLQLFTSFSLPENNQKTSLRCARLYICGLGLYEAYLNDTKIGEEFFTPGCNNYDQWLQYQTYDITQHLQQTNQLKVFLGDGWYKGPFAFQGKKEIYGDTQMLLAEIHLSFSDGSRQVIATDSSWQAQDSPIRDSTIYDGETYDATFIPKETLPAEVVSSMGYDTLQERISPPVRIMETLTPKEIIVTPKGETVLDMGQIITGHLQFYDRAQKGHTYHLEYGEILQDGCFYNENLRTAKQAYHYTSNGTPSWIRPFFTFYGFRFVKLEGFANAKIEDFTGCVLYSEMVQTGFLQTSHPKVNRLALNALWGQKGNFLDVPTDCPQRDERMGWTGDAQAFCATACYQMDCAAFFTKYLYDMDKEQQLQEGGVPHVVPSFHFAGSPSCAWADAATIIPWTLYLFYGDKALLEKQYTNMTQWVNWIRKIDADTGHKRLWHAGFHFADWLALDTAHMASSSPIGGTDPDYIASIYYLYSTRLTAKAANVLGKTQDARTYELLAEEILAALRKEYLSQTGRLAVSTQTGYILALMMGLYRTEEEAVSFRVALERAFKASHGELRTGFVGTGYLCKVLTQNGLGHLAYSLFLREEYPSWLYEVNMGATTVWERWNSVLPNGKISDTGMNSLNHYAYGAVMEWVYQYVAGICPTQEGPGFRKVRMAPHFDSRLPEGSFRFDSPVGTYESSWKITDEKNVLWTFTVPFGGQAELILPLAKVTGDLSMEEKEGKMVATAFPGTYTLQISFVSSPWKKLPIDIPFATLMEEENMKVLLYTLAPDLDQVFIDHPKDQLAFSDLREAFFSPLPPAQLKRLEEAFNDLSFRF